MEPALVRATRHVLGAHLVSKPTGSEQIPSEEANADDRNMLLSKWLGENDISGNLLRTNLNNDCSFSSAAQRTTIVMLLQTATLCLVAAKGPLLGLCPLMEPVVEQVITLAKEAHL